MGHWVWSIGLVTIVGIYTCHCCGNMKLTVILEPSDEGGYTAYVPSLPGCVSEGEDIDDALANIQEAIELYLEPVEQEVAFTK